MNHMKIIKIKKMIVSKVMIKKTHNKKIVNKKNNQKIVKKLLNLMMNNPIIHKKMKQIQIIKMKILN